MLSFLAISILLISSLLSAAPEQQQPLITIGDGDEAKDLDLIYELRKAEIIPTVIDEFIPLLSIKVNWKNASADYGNTINPSLVQDQPSVKFIDQVPDLHTRAKGPQLTLAMSDPDAPSRENPEWSEICHWVATSIPLTKPSSNDILNTDFSVYSFEDVMPYKPPGPPEKTGKHRYVFVALVPKNGTTEALELRKPGDRQHWGYENERQGLRKWAEEMGLEVVGANFIYSKNDKQ